MYTHQRVHTVSSLPPCNSLHTPPIENTEVYGYYTTKDQMQMAHTNVVNRAICLEPV